MQRPRPRGLLSLPSPPPPPPVHPPKARRKVSLTAMSEAASRRSGGTRATCDHAAVSGWKTQSSLLARAAGGPPFRRGVSFCPPCTKRRPAAAAAE